MRARSIFHSKEEWQKHDNLRNRQRDYYFDILNQLQGKQDIGEKDIEISEIKPEYTENKKVNWPGRLLWIGFGSKSEKL